MKVLVTGASGFIGLALTQYLSLSTEIQVIGMVRSKTHGLENSNIEFRFGEMCHKKNLDIDLTDIDIVIHTAGRAHIMDDKSLNPIDDFRRINTQGTLNIARLAASSGVKRFIFLSSIKVNGDSTDRGLPFSVDSDENPKDAYGVSKYEAEIGLRKISCHTNLEVTIIRPPLVYGEGVKGNFHTLVKLLSSRFPLPLASLTTNRRSMVGLDNLISLIETCLHHPNAVDQTFLVSDDSDISTADLLRLLGSSIGKPARLLRCPESILCFFAKLFGMEFKLQRITGTLQLDISHTCNQLEWSPPFSMVDGLKKLKDKC